MKRIKLSAILVIIVILSVAVVNAPCQQRDHFVFSQLKYRGGELEPVPVKLPGDNKPACNYYQRTA